MFIEANIFRFMMSIIIPAFITFSLSLWFDQLWLSIYYLFSEKLLNLTIFFYLLLHFLFFIKNLDVCKSIYHIRCCPVLPLSSPPLNLENLGLWKKFQQKILYKKLRLWTYCELDLLIFVCFSYLNTMN